MLQVIPGVGVERGGRGGGSTTANAQDTNYLPSSVVVLVIIP